MKSVNRVRLVKSGNPDAYVTVNCKVCNSAAFLIVPSCVSKVFLLYSPFDH
jgi:hypothetical protein